jgi:hypothetical protein
MERMRQAFCPRLEFVGMADYALTLVYDLLEGESCDSSSKSSPGKDKHPSRQCNMVHAAGVDPAGGAGDEPAHPLVQHTSEEQAAYEQERLERAKACGVDDERECGEQARAANARLAAPPRTAVARGRARAVVSSRNGWQLIYSKCIPRIVIGDSLAHNDSRCILVQAILPYVQSGFGWMYCLGLGARESLESYKLSSGE